MDIFVYKKNHVSACAKEWTLLLLNFISNEKTILIASIPCRCSAYLTVDVKKIFKHVDAACV